MSKRTWIFIAILALVGIGVASCINYNIEKTRQETKCFLEQDNRWTDEGVYIKNCN